MFPYIGIVKGNHGWVQILNQEGLLFKIFKPGDNPVVLIVDELTKKSEILDYLSEGGCILTDTETLGSLLGESVRSVIINSIIPDGSDLFRNVGIVDVYNKGYVINKKGFGTINNKFPALYDFSYKNGFGISLPFNISSVIFDTTRRMKYFYNEYGKFPADCVSSVSKGEVRKLAVNAIRYLFSKKGTNYFHKWYYPDGKRNAFLFRVDTDKSNFDEIYNTYKIVDEHDFCCTFFIDVKSLGGSQDALKELKNQEIAVHCFEHKVFKDPLRNRKNFSRAKRLLQKVSIETYGLAVPYGVWNNSIGFVTEDLKFKYSSESSFSYDDLPSYPYINARLSHVLQIPVHPISPGTLLHAKNSIDVIKKYFEKIIEEKYSNDEPLFLYGHSEVISRYPSILEYIINVVKEKSEIWMGTYRDFYDWWMERENTNPKILIDGITLKMNGIDKNSRLTFRIITPEGRNAIIPLKKEVDLEELKFTEMAKSKPFDKNKLKIKQGNFKLKLKEIENWIKR